MTAVFIPLLFALLTVKASRKQELILTYICIPYSDKHSVCITGANKYLLNLVLEKLLPYAEGWRSKLAGSAMYIAMDGK